MWLYSPPDTQWLTRASFEPAAGRRVVRRSLAAIFAFLLVIGAGASVYPVRLAETMSRNADLGEEIERLRMELKMERATRAELHRQIDAMNKQITELNHQLEFLASRTGKSARRS